MNTNTIVNTDLVDYNIDEDMTTYLENLNITVEKYNNQNAVFGSNNQTGEKPYIAFLNREIINVKDKINQVNGFINESQKECNEGKIIEEENIKNIDAYFSLLADLKLELKTNETDLSLSILMQTDIKKKSDLVWTKAQLNDSHVTGEKRDRLEYNKAMLEDELNKISFEKKSQILSLFEYSNKTHKPEIDTRKELYTTQYNNTPSNLGAMIPGLPENIETEEDLDNFLGNIKL